MNITRAFAALSLASAALFGAVAPASAVAPVLEDDPGWSCVTDGNRICGPGNTEGKPAGCYDDGGVWVAAWPCHVVVNPDGSSDVYAP